MNISHSMIPGEIIILAGGKGSRLKDVLGDLPKSLAPVNGRPFIDYLIHYYRKQGLRKFIFCLGEGHQQLSAHIQHAWKDLDVEIVIETAALDTGGAILNAIGHAIDDTVLVVNGDSYFKTDVRMLSESHHKYGAECTIAVKQVPDTARYGRLELQVDGRISLFHEKGVAGKGFINGGVYLINTGIFKANDLPARFSFEKDYLQPYFREKKIYAVIQDDYFIDIGIPGDLAKAQQEIKNHGNGLDA